MNDPVIQKTNQGVSTQTIRSQKDLVFDPISGEFVLVPHGEIHEGDTVTRLSEDGFAGNDAESQDLQNSMQSDSSQTSTHLKDLVFDPETGTLEEVEHNNGQNAEQILGITLEEVFA
jgi:hypothetical protein